MKIKIKNFFTTILVFASISSAQTVKFVADPGFVPYATYYISSIGFRLVEDSDDYSNVWTSLEFKVSLVSKSLGVMEPTTVIHMRTAPFQMNAAVRISNTSLSTQATSLFDMSIPPKEIIISARLIESIDIWPSSFVLTL